MAKALGICQSTLQREFRRRGFKACRTGQRKWLWSKAQLERWYNEYGMSIQDICDLTGLTHNTVWKQMVNFGIPRRPAKFNHKEIKRKPPEYGQPPEKILRDWADSMVRAMTGE
jgi:hypothetical protein